MVGITLIHLFLFLTLSFLIFYSIGFLILSFLKEKLESQELIALSFCLGIIIFVLIGILFGLLHLRMLVLPVLFVVSVISILRSHAKLIYPWKIFIREKILLALIILGILVQGFINFPSGYLYNGELLFWSSHGHDGIWHVALMEEIKKNFPPQNPIFAGESLYNYHFLVDVLMGEFYRIFPFFSALDLYFRFFPVVFSFVIGITVFAFVNRWQKNKNIGFLAVFFSYFAGSFGYIVTYIKNGTIFAGEALFWAAQQNTILGNPPHAASHFVLPAFFLSFYIFLQKRSKAWFIISLLIGSTLAGFKVSGGLVMLTGLGAAALVELIFRRKFIVSSLTFFLGISNFITFKAMTSNDAASFLMFLPWWFIRTMIVVKLDWIDLEHKRQHYLSVGSWKATLRVIQLELMALTIFIVGNLGMRVLGFIEIINQLFKKKLSIFKDTMDIMLFVSMLTGLIMPLLFVQKGIIYNNIQFMQYFLLIFGFFAASSVYKLLNMTRNRVVRIVLLTLIISFSIPTVIGNFFEFYDRPAIAKISKSEIEALKYLKYHSHPDAIVLNAPFNRYLSGQFKSQPWPIYTWYSTAYISALAGRRSFLSSEEQALITGYPIDNRLDKMKLFFEQSDFLNNRVFLKNDKISYIYLPKKEIVTSLDKEMNGLEIFFENNEVIIYKVR